MMIIITVTIIINLVDMAVKGFTIIKKTTPKKDKVTTIFQ